MKVWISCVSTQAARAPVAAPEKFCGRVGIIVGDPSAGEAGMNKKRFFRAAWSGEEGICSSAYEDLPRLFPQRYS
jgi:hypothetical protein